MAKRLNEEVEVISSKHNMISLLLPAHARKKSAISTKRVWLDPDPFWRTPEEQAPVRRIVYVQSNASLATTSEGRRIGNKRKAKEIMEKQGNHWVEIQGMLDKLPKYIRMMRISRGKMCLRGYVLAGEALAEDEFYQGLGCLPNPERPNSSGCSAIFMTPTN